MQIEPKPQPWLATEQEIRQMIGIGRDLFAEIKHNIPVVRIKRRRLYDPDDVRREVNNLKTIDAPCTNPQKSFSQRNRPAITRISQSMELGLDAAVKRTTGRKLTSLAGGYTNA